MRHNSVTFTHFTVLALALIIVLIHGDLGNYNESEKWKVIPVLHQDIRCPADHNMAGGISSKM